MVEEISFFADVMLGKLAKWMRVLGWDCGYRNDISDRRLLREAEREGRVVLTRDRRMTEEWKIASYFLVRSDDPAMQLREVVARFGMPAEEKRFGRCLVCNLTLEPRDRREIVTEVPAYIAAVHRLFSSCPCCGRIYWRGSHHAGMSERLASLLADIPRPPEDRPPGSPDR